MLPRLQTLKHQSLGILSDKVPGLVESIELG